MRPQAVVLLANLLRGERLLGVSLDPSGLSLKLVDLGDDWRACELDALLKILRGDGHILDSGHRLGLGRFRCGRRRSGWGWGASVGLAVGARVGRPAKLSGILLQATRILKLFDQALDIRLI